MTLVEFPLELNGETKLWKIDKMLAEMLASFCYNIEEDWDFVIIITGNRMVILVTDGEVSSHEINELRNHILKHGAEVRCMVVGVGASLTGTFVETIAGDNNILAQDHSDAVIMDCIKTMLE